MNVDMSGAPWKQLSKVGVSGAKIVYLIILNVIKSN